MRRDGLAVLALGVAAVPMVAFFPLAIFLGWILAAVGLALLARDEPTRAPARAGLWILGAVVGLGLAGAGFTLGRGGRTLLATEGFDPSTGLVSLAIVAAWCAAGAFLLLVEIGRGQRLALVGGALMLFGLTLFLADEWARVGIVERPFFYVGGSALSFLMVVGGALLVMSFARMARGSRAL